MATLDDKGRITGGKVAYHSERALEAIRQSRLLGPWLHIASLGEMVDTLAYDHARGAARATLNRTRKVKR